MTEKQIISRRCRQQSIRQRAESGGDAYDNFDLNMYSYNPQSAADAKKTVQEYSGRMLQKAYGSSTVEPPEITPAEPLNGTFFKDVTVHDTAYASLWSIKQNLNVGSTVLGDRTFALTVVPQELRRCQCGRCLRPCRCSRTAKISADG